MWARMAWTARGSWTVAITRSRPPQRGQARANTRCINGGQVQIRPHATDTQPTALPGSPAPPCPHLEAMALQRAVYRPRDAEHTVLHQVVATHLEAFLRAVAAAWRRRGPAAVRRARVPWMVLLASRAHRVPEVAQERAGTVSGAFGSGVLVSRGRLSAQLLRHLVNTWS
jgi:hypothetical protein